MQGEARQLIKEGRVTAVYPERHSVRVTFEDKDNLPSAELPVLTTFACQNKCYSLPDVNEIVVCAFASNDEIGGAGWVIGSRFHDNSTPNAASQDKTRIDFNDGTFIEYDRASHTLKIECTGEIYIKGRRIYLND